MSSFGHKVLTEFINCIDILVSLGVCLLMIAVVGVALIFAGIGALLKMVCTPIVKRS